MSFPINNVADTAFWIAYHRALESRRSDALFQDPFAAKLAGERGRKISEAMPTSRVVAWTVALRTRIIDDYIAFAIDAGIDTVLNLGAGLDARPYRLKLPGTLRWIEADYPHLIEYKEAPLRSEPKCNLERVGIDLANRTERQALFARVNAQATGILILTEGVIPYLTNDDVDTLAQDVTAMKNARFWILDFFSEAALKYRRRKPVDHAMRNAPFRFAPGDWFGFFRKQGWQANERPLFPGRGAATGTPDASSGPHEDPTDDGATLGDAGEARGHASVCRLCAAGTVVGQSERSTVIPGGLSEWGLKIIAAGICRRPAALAIAILMGVGGIPAAAQADSSQESRPTQTTASMFEIAAFGGIAVGGHFKLENAGGSDNGDSIALADHGSFALAADLRADEGSQYELFYGRQATALRDNATNERTNITVEYLHLGGTLLLDERTMVQPYLVGGVGATRFTPGADGSTDTRFSASLGLGLRWAVTRHLSVRLEGRGFVTLVNPDSAIFCQSDQAGLLCRIHASGQTFVQGQFLAGAAFAF